MTIAVTSDRTAAGSVSFEYHGPTFEGVEGAVPCGAPAAVLGQRRLATPRALRELLARLEEARWDPAKPPTPASPGKPFAHRAKYTMVPDS